MIRHTPLLKLLASLSTGCYRNVRAPGAVGKVFDADTGFPVRGAHITRPHIRGGLYGGVFVPYAGIPAATTVSDKSGSFNLPPVLETHAAFMYLRNPESVSGLFVVSADGFVTNEMQSLATKQSSWRVGLGRVLLKKP